ncbi:MAG: hypothetical protein JWO40_372 [Candidatus Doudnabacteria bacterium]|nr:hypothetical protein [Candidatus Doudnabacteria bacterium]
MRHKILVFIEKFLYIIFSIVFVVVGVAIMLSVNQVDQSPRVYGATFRYPYAQDLLGLDWKKVYVSMIEDIQIKNIRIPVYWDEIEKVQGTYDFSNVDYQVQTAEQYNAKVILVVGRRVPGWPECHIPGWAQSLDNKDPLQAHVMDEIKAVVERYKDSPALIDWQVENEPFLTRFGQCGTYPVAQYLDQEIALVKQLDSNHPVIVTDSGELALWLPAASRADIFGNTLYKKVYADRFKGYIDYHLPPIFFRAKRGMVHFFYPNKKIINIELQAEPWTTKGITNTSFEEQAITFPTHALRDNVQFAHDAGYSTVYVWGVEYWYWAAQHGHPEFLDEAKQYLH